LRGKLFFPTAETQMQRGFGNGEHFMGAKKQMPVGFPKVFKFSLKKS
jgi:hypothetical protein